MFVWLLQLQPLLQSWTIWLTAFFAACFRSWCDLCMRCAGCRWRWDHRARIRTPNHCAISKEYLKNSKAKHDQLQRYAEQQIQYYVQIKKNMTKTCKEFNKVLYLDLTFLQTYIYIWMKQFYRFQIYSIIKLPQWLRFILKNDWNRLKILAKHSGFSMCI